MGEREERESIPLAWDPITSGHSFLTYARISSASSTSSTFSRPPSFKLFSTFEIENCSFLGFFLFLLCFFHEHRVSSLFCVFVFLFIIPTFCRDFAYQSDHFF